MSVQKSSEHRSTTIELQLTDYPPTCENRDLLERCFVENAHTPEEIATRVFSDRVSPEQICEKLIEFELFESWKSEEFLDRQFNARGLSTRKIANDCLQEHVCAETVRYWLNKHDLISEERTYTGSRSKLKDKLMEMDPDQIGDPTPEGDDSYKDFTATGRTRGEHDAA